MSKLKTLEEEIYDKNIDAFLEEIENTMVMALLETEGKYQSSQGRAEAILKFIRKAHKAKKGGGLK